MSQWAEQPKPMQGARRAVPLSTRRRIDVLWPQLCWLAVVACGVAATLPYEWDDSAKVFIRTLAYGVAAGTVSAALLDYFVSSSLFLDETAPTAASALAFAGLLATLAATHASYSRLGFGGSLLALLAVQWWACRRAVRRGHIRLAALDPLAHEVLARADRNRSELMRDVAIDRIEVDAAATASSLVGRVDALVVGDPPPVGSAREALLVAARVAGLHVYSAAHIYELMSGRVALATVHSSLFDDAARYPLYDKFKRLLDLAGALVLVVLTLPLMLLAALAIRLESPGGAIFSQTRVGQGGRPIRVYKLRSMRSGAAEQGATEDADDARITALGRYLRRTRIDELPQLWNVIRGDMSLIGPRPEWDVTERQLEAEIPQFRLRLLVRPGITGWAQVHQGHVTQADEVRTKLEYDLFYIRHMSLILDLAIGWRTLRTVLTWHGAK